MLLIQRCTTLMPFGLRHDMPFDPGVSIEPDGEYFFY